MNTISERFNERDCYYDTEYTITLSDGTIKVFNTYNGAVRYLRIQGRR